MIQEPFDSYLKNSGISASELKQLRISPKHYKCYIDNKDKQEEEKRHLIIGSAIHCNILEQDKFLSQYACLKNSMLPAKNINGVANFSLKENKNYRDVIFPAMNAGKTILTEPEWELIENVCKSARENKAVARVLKNGRAELSFYMKDEKTKQMLKARCDFLPDKGNAIVDFKTCLDSSPRSFTNTVFNLGYHLQSAHYLNLFQRESFVFIACEQSEPYTIQPYVLDQEVLNVGKDEWRMLVDILHFSNKTRHYFDYSEFSILKDIYKKKMLYEKSWEETYQTLTMFFEINTGVYSIGLPGWMKH